MNPVQCLAPSAQKNQISPSSKPHTRIQPFQFLMHPMLHNGFFWRWPWTGIKAKNAYWYDPLRIHILLRFCTTVTAVYIEFSGVTHEVGISMSVKDEIISRAAAKETFTLESITRGHLLLDLSWRFNRFHYEGTARDLGKHSKGDLRPLGWKCMRACISVSLSLCPLQNVKTIIDVCLKSKFWISFFLFATSHVLLFVTFFRNAPPQKAETAVPAQRYLN